MRFGLLYSMSCDPNLNLQRPPDMQKVIFLGRKPITILVAMFCSSCIIMYVGMFDMMSLYKRIIHVLHATVQEEDQ